MPDTQRPGLTPDQIIQQILPQIPGSTPATAPTFNVKYYGAVGNGVADDTNAIANAAAAAIAVGGGTVFFPPGTYITGPQTGYGNVEYRGAGVTATTLMLKSGSNGTLLSVATQNAGNMTVIDMTLDGNASNNVTTSHLIVGQNHRNLMAERVKFQNWNGNAFRAFGTGGSYPNLSIQPRVVNCQFDNGNGINTSGSCITFDSGSTDGLIFAADCGRGYRGILFSFGGNPHHKISDSWCWGSVDVGLYLYQSGAVLIDNLTVESNTQLGVRMDGSQHVQWIGGRVMHNGTSAANTYDNMQILNGTTMTMVGTIIGDDLGSAPRYGINADGASTVVVTKSCEFFGNATAARNTTNGAVITPMTVSPAVPASGTAVAATYYDRTFYVTAGVGGCTMTIQGGPAVVIPATSVCAVRVPAGQTVTPTYTSAPTWVVESE